MSAIENKIQELKKNGFKLSFGDTLQDCFQIFQNIFWYGALVFLIVAVYGTLLGFVVNILPYMSKAKGEIVSILEQRPFEYSAIQEVLNVIACNPLTLLISFILLILFSLMFPLIAGIINMAYMYDKTKETNISYLYEGFNGNKFGRLVLLYILYILASVVGLAIFGFGAILPFVGFSIASCFIMFNHMSTWKAIKASFAITYKKFLVVLFLLIVSFILASLGILVCFVGLLFTLPFTVVMCYAIYKHSVGTDLIDNEVV